MRAFLVQVVLSEIPNSKIQVIMAKDKYGGHTPKVESTVRTGRKQLLDITNTGVRLVSSLKDARGDALSTPLSKGSTAHLLKEVGLLQKLLAEKEAIIESKNLEMKRIWINWVQVSQQNKQLIRRNCEMSKESTFDQEKVSFLSKFKHYLFSFTLH
ncbi:uncharacterized protein LOC131073403 [Cryptomeria japonica]|uniref:uncharacterized protein LOC131073403 n=1 Tax=Cryptomeria japonica TaxID=3369 RepID=UPI0025ACD678|nr:uncharacterized protein LOC131073403 [Cryptomeria japonica]XP_057865831.1 uncharacterized protein LOC131073403 [Cryptomeria japonica]XP_057865832.1 uncharacterized protein LOC131073403 [Cryptomeria japonica]XP_057865833.1 uncharacterized protein LOC131073403 [Cryptomeria japonica]